MDERIPEKLFMKEGLTMKDITFYQALCRCYSQHQNCLKCPLYAMYGNRECKLELVDEISNRKIAAIRKEESDNEG